MAEYIDKSVLIAMCKGIAAFDRNKNVAPVSWADAYERFADEVEDFDAADVVERKRGRWENIVYDPVLRKMEATCSYCACRGEVRVKANCCGFVVPDSSFCPTCGADMREVNDAN